MKTKLYYVSIRCYYEDGQTTHRQEIKLSDIAKWIEAYRFTHPNVQSISAKIWFNNMDMKEE